MIQKLLTALLAAGALLAIPPAAHAHPARDRECGSAGVFSRIQSGADRHQVTPVLCKTARKAIRYLEHHPMDGTWVAGGPRWHVSDYGTEDGCYVTIYSGVRRVYGELRDPWTC